MLLSRKSLIVVLLLAVLSDVLMIRAFCLPKLLYSSMSRRLHYSSLSLSNDWSTLAQDWTLEVVAVKSIASAAVQPTQELTKAIERSLPLLDDSNSVPFVCRYRTDVISPLSVPQVHFLSDKWQKHKSLAALRDKLLAVAPNQLHRKILTSTSKSELDDLYAPYKPPSKGSIADRIQREHPELVQLVEGVWSGEHHVPAHKLRPYDDAVHLIASRIASDPTVMDQLTDRLQRDCRIKIVEHDDKDQKYNNYHDFDQSLHSLRDYQVLAISRAVDQKALKMSYDVDSEKMQDMLRWLLTNQVLPLKLAKDCKFNNDYKSLLQDVVKDAWTRLLRRKLTTRLWSHKVKVAQLRAMQVFQDNLRNALLAPPMTPPTPILALDPGFQAGIKCAVLDRSGQLLTNSLTAVRFLGNNREGGIEKLIELLKLTKEQANFERVTIALGNGHGTHECRQLIQEASAAAGIAIEICMVNEAGASVWSVSEIASAEFPSNQPSEIAAISIGRRLQNPLQELIKVPPRSLGLGMYQHDLSEKELDEHLQLTCVDAVAEVGVDANTCTLEILQKVPGLNKLAPKVIKARPIKNRKDLLKIAGLGPTAFENCAAFVRCHGTEELDSTLVHPESYELARWLIKKRGWKLSSPPRIMPLKEEWISCWADMIEAASSNFDVSTERILSVTEQIVDSMTNIDPRLKERSATSQGSVKAFTPLSPELCSNVDALRKACPVRGIVGTIRNIADFGVFIDFGGHNDGLVHKSKLGSLAMGSLLIGQTLGVDIIKVEANQKVSLALAGLGCEPEGQNQPGQATDIPLAQKRLYTSGTSAKSSVKRRKREGE